MVYSVVVWAVAITRIRIILNGRVDIRLCEQYCSQDGGFGYGHCYLLARASSMEKYFMVRLHDIPFLFVF